MTSDICAACCSPDTINWEVQTLTNTKATGSLWWGGVAKVFPNPINSYKDKKVTANRWQFSKAVNLFGLFPIFQEAVSHLSYLSLPIYSSCMHNFPWLWMRLKCTQRLLDLALGIVYAYCRSGGGSSFLGFTNEMKLRMELLYRVCSRIEPAPAL